MTIEIRNGNLDAFTRFFDRIEDTQIKRTGNCLTVTVSAEAGNARFIKYVAEKYGCNAKQIT